MKQPFTPAMRPLSRVVSPVWQYPLAWLLVVLLSIGLVQGTQAQISITSFAPTGGPVGSTVIITGGTFVAPVSLTIGGVGVTSGSFSSTQITCLVPTGAVTGPIVVTSNGNVASSATNFVVTTAGQYLMSNDPVTACSGTLYDSGGPTDPYYNNEVYAKVLTPSTAGAKMRLTFNSFDLENTYDFVSIYDGPSTTSPLIGTYTGTNTPGTVTATNSTGQLTVVFTSDVSQTPSGFAAAISCVITNTFVMDNSPVTTCSGTFYDSGGPAGTYLDNEVYTKVFTPATPGAKMRMTFTSFELETGPYDYLYIYDGPSTSASLIGTYSGTTSPGTVTATNATGQLTVRFTSDVSQTRLGWAATLSCTAPVTFSVTSRSPAANVVNAPLASNIAVGFSTTPALLASNNIRVFGNLGQGLRAMGLSTVSGTTATLPLTAPVFLPGETVSITVPSTVLSTTGAIAVPYTYQFTTATTASSGRFGAPVAYASGTNPGDMVMGDITGDNRPDIVVANTTDNTVSVFPGLSTGAFGARVDYPANAGPLGIVLGDLNGDGRLDVVVANSTTSSVSVLLNTGAGLGTPAQYPASNVPGLVAVGDMNGDGLLDIVLSNAGDVNAGFGNTVSVYLNLGSGIFNTRTDYTTGTDPNGVAVGDVNNDGKLDIVTSNLNDNTASVLLGTGNGNFAAKVDYATASTPFYVALNDLNADGRLDIVTGNNSVNGVSVLLSAASTGSAYLARTDYNTGTTPQDVDLADVNGDGRFDIITANQGTNNATVLLATGPGTFGTRTDFATGLGTASTALADVNGDGRLDLAAMNSTANTVSVLLGVAAPTITSFTPGSGSVGATVTVTGTNFTGATALTLNGVTVTGFTVNGTGTTITFTVPSGASTGLLAVTTPGGTATSTTNFTVTTSAQLVVTQGGFPYPSNGTAYNFGSRTVGSTSAAVTFILANPGSGALTLSSVSTTGNFAVSGPAPTTVPAGGTASVNVTFSPTTAGAQTGTLRLVSALGTYVVNLSGTGVYAVPTIGSISPASGPVGTVVTVTGTGFVSGSTTVTINGVTITGVTVGAGGTTLTFTIPAGATSGPVVVTTPGGTSTGATPYCVQYTPTTAATPVSRCGPGSVVLTASGAPTGGTYAWYTQQTGGTAISGATAASYTTPSLSATTVYYVAISTGSGTNACQGPRTAVSAVINAIPVVTITTTTPTTFCQGGSVVLTATGASTYQWSTGATTASITVTDGGSYAVTGTSTAGCSATSAATLVTVTPLPTFPTTTPASRCGAGTVTLAASGAPVGGSYVWYSQQQGGMPIAVAVINTYTTPVLTATTPYFVSISTSGGCEGPRMEVVATINPVPTVAITTTTPTTFCQGGSVVLTATGASTYQWSTGATTASITVTTSGSYTVTGTSAEGCPATSAATTVTVNPLPTTPTTTPAASCGPGSVVLTASGTPTGGTYAWYTQQTGGTAISGATAASYTTPGISATTIYYVSAVSASGCESPRVPVTATVNTVPTVSITTTTPTTFCSGGSVVLTATGAASYQWSTGATTASITVTTGGSYSVTGTSAAGCLATSAATTVTVNPTPSAPTTTGAASCAAGSLTLMASGATAGDTYAWYTTATGGTAISGITGGSYTTPALSATTTYYVSVVGAGGCESPRTSVTATISALPVVTVTPTGPMTFCQGGSVVLTASGANTYVWSTGATTASITVSSMGIYTVTGTVAAGCVAAPVATTVIVNAAPSNPTTTPAASCGPGSVTLAASGAPTDGSYAWYTQQTGGTAISGATGASYTTPSLTTTTTYYVSALNAGGCESVRAAVVATINPVPTVSIAAGGATSFCQGGSVVLTASGADTYLWSNGATTASITVTAGGSYTVAGNTTAGCTATSAATAVTVEPLPATPVITQSPAGTLSSSAATGNQWYFGPNLIPGATGPTYVVTSAAGNGSYTVVTTSATGCVSAASAAVTVTITGTASAALTAAVLVYPNPAHSTCTVQVPAIAGASNVELTLLNALGQTVQQRLVALPASGARAELDLHHIASGVYLVRLQAGSTTVYKRLTID